MCVIIIKQKNNVMSEEVAKTSSRINPHGLGIIWLDTFEVEYHKSKDYRKLLTQRVKSTEPTRIHLYVATTKMNT